MNSANHKSVYYLKPLFIVSVQNMHSNSPSLQELVTFYIPVLLTTSGIVSLSLPSPVPPLIPPEPPLIPLLSLLLRLLLSLFPIPFILLPCPFHPFPFPKFPLNMEKSLHQLQENGNLQTMLILNFRSQLYRDNWCCYKLLYSETPPVSSAGLTSLRVNFTHGPPPLNRNPRVQGSKVLQLFAN